MMKCTILRLLIDEEKTMMKESVMEGCFGFAPQQFGARTSQKSHHLEVPAMQFVPF
jgi:hypothetical protein